MLMIADYKSLLQEGRNKTGLVAVSHGDFSASLLRSFEPSYFPQAASLGSRRVRWGLPPHLTGRGGRSSGQRRS